MKRITDIEESRRQFLLSLLGAGAFMSLPVHSAQFSRLPNRLPPGQSIYRYVGDIRVNGVAATLNSTIAAGDVITTGPRSFIIFVVEQDAFILRSNSEMTVRPAPEASPTVARPGTVKAAILPTAYALKRGKALSVLASRRTRISTPTAIIGIRGTGVYVEANPDEAYVCVCYGATDLASAQDPTITEEVIAEHHDAPKYISGGTNPRIAPAPFKNHDDEELLLIETLVGRTTPYMVPQGIPRTRNSYF